VRLLVVDDDTVFRQGLGELLEQDGHQVELAPTVPRALEFLAAEQRDLIFTDLKMPRHNGLELLREVRSRWPKTLVVMITGFATVDTAVEAMKLGAFDYIAKPFQIKQVQAVLQLAEQEIKFQGRGALPPKIELILKRWTVDGLPVLHVTPRPGRPQALVTELPLPAEPHRIRDAVESFLPEHPRAGVLLEGVDRLFEGRAGADFVPFIRSIRDRIGERGPLVVTFDPTRHSAAEVEELTAALAGPATRSALEALSNPIRRAVLQRAGHGPITFTQAMEAAGIDDSPKLSFHLRRLVDEGMLGHAHEQYRISARGEESLQILGRWDSLASTGPIASTALPQTG
jgi:ActR/RegA family two-component response regulator